MRTSDSRCILFETLLKLYKILNKSELALLADEAAMHYFYTQGFILLPIKQPPYPKQLMLRHELDTLGLSLSHHPLERYEGIVRNMNYVMACDLNAHVGKTITTIGWLVSGKTVHTKNGEPMKFVSFENTTGLYETVFFPKVYNQFCHILNEMRPYILKGKVEEDFGSVSLTVNWIGFLDRCKTKTSRSSKWDSDFCSHLKPRTCPTL